MPRLMAKAAPTWQASWPIPLMWKAILPCRCSAQLRSSTRREINIVQYISSKVSGVNRGLIGLIRRRNDEGKGIAFVRLRCNRDRAALLFDEGFDQCQAEARVFIGFVGFLFVAIHMIKQVKDF